MASVIKVDQIQSDTGQVNLASNLAFTGTSTFVGGSFNSPNITTPNISNPTITGTLNLVGGGISFPATEVAISDPNTLDDYEEGTVTLTWYSGANGTGTNLGSSTAKYVKVGKIVNIVFFRGVGGSTACLSFVGLPFITNLDGCTCITADSAVCYHDGTYPQTMSYRGAGDGQYSRGTLTYQT